MKQPSQATPSIPQLRNSDTKQHVACGPPRVSCVLRASVCWEPTSQRYPSEHQGFPPQFDHVLVAGLVAVLDLIPLPTIAVTGFGRTASSASTMNLDVNDQ